MASWSEIGKIVVMFLTIGGGSFLLVWGFAWLIHKYL